MTTDVDIVIRNGRVIDPGNYVDDVLDITVKCGLIHTIGKKLDVKAIEEFDATSCIVTPGLIDAHLHCYQYATPLGVNPDETCLARGVTTVIDAGSAGANTFMGLMKFIIDKSETRVKALLHIALHGLAAAGCAGNGSKYGCPANLGPGDIYTHSYHGFNQTIIDQRTLSVHRDVREAKSRGVIFDVGHGSAAFSWTVAELAIKDGLFPDSMGSDLHIENTDGPVYDLVTLMTKFLHLGMPLFDVIKAVTSSPAKVYGLDDITGSLSIGKEADISILKIEENNLPLEDSIGQIRNPEKRLVPVAVWRAGKRHQIKESTWDKQERSVDYSGNRRTAIITDEKISSSLSQ